MILPSKHLRTDQSLLYVGGQLLQLLVEPKTVSRLWDDMKQLRMPVAEQAPLSYDWFVLAIDLLYALGAVDLKDGRLQRNVS